MSNAQAIAPRDEEPAGLPAAASGPVTPAEMLNNAIARGASIEVVEKLMAMHERMEAAAARKAFDEAIAEAKSELSPVVKTREGHNSKYADFAAIAAAVDPVLSKHGLSYRHKSEQTDRINVTCILSHRAGHSEQTTLSGPPDTSGSKNAIQAIGSTLTYLQRYTLLLALGLATAHDDDGKAAGAGETVSDDQIDAIEEEMSAAAAETKAKPEVYRANFLKYMRVENVAQIPAKDFDKALAAIKSTRAK